MLVVMVVVLDGMRKLMVIGASNARSWMNRKLPWLALKILVVNFDILGNDKTSRLGVFMSWARSCSNIRCQLIVCRVILLNGS